MFVKLINLSMVYIDDLQESGHILKKTYFANVNSIFNPHRENDISNTDAAYVLHTSFEYM